MILRVSIGALTPMLSALLLAGCGGQQVVKPKAIGFEPAILGCSVATECTSGNELMLRESREAEKRRCPADKPDVLVKANGVMRCVAELPSAGQTGIGLSVPGAVHAKGGGAVSSFEAGEAVAARSGCLACHRIGGEGNNGPGSELTHVGSRLPPAALARALVDSPEPMPSFSRLPEGQRRALVYFLAQLR
jgi:mono/diheme cytochrome c family protein